MEHSLIIDCDTGRDDALAIWLALALDMKLSGVVTSYGNTTHENVRENTARVLSLAGRDDLPLLCGADKPSRDHVAYHSVVLPRHEVSGNGLCDIELPKANRKIPQPVSAAVLAERLRQLANENGPLEYVITGPATNLAAVCNVLGQQARHVIARITMMGGKFEPLWGQLPGGDFNVIADPYAVRSLLNAGLAMRFVPMNATWPIKLELDEIERLQADGKIAQLAKELMVAHCRYFAPEPVFRFHDPCVILALWEEKAFVPERISVQCDEKSADFGRLIPGETAVEIFRPGSQLEHSFLNRNLHPLGLRQT